LDGPALCDLTNIYIYTDLGRKTRLKLFY